MDYFLATQEQVFSPCYRLVWCVWGEPAQAQNAWVRINMKISLLTTWQVTIVLDHCLGRIPLANVRGIMISCQNNEDSNLFLLIKKKMNAKRSTSDKQ